MRSIEKLQEKILEQLDLSHEIDDSQLMELIHQILEEQSRDTHIPLKEKSQLGKELFNAFRKLDLLQELIEDEEKTMARIAELQDFLKEIREARKQEEDLEIVRSIRSMKLGARDLFDLLTAIQDGNLSDELREQLLAAQEAAREAEEALESHKSAIIDAMNRLSDVRTSEARLSTMRRELERRGEDGIRENTGSDPENDEDGAMMTPEREENNNDRHHN